MALCHSRFNEDTKLAAAQLAFDNQFYEMAINTAESTDQKIELQLALYFVKRLSKKSYKHKQGWIWHGCMVGFAKSRFMLGAQSSVGAQGLMQVMPATAREIANKIRHGQQRVISIPMIGNIRMGTWYMANARRNLRKTTKGWQPQVITQGRGARNRVQASTPLEGNLRGDHSI